MDDNPLGRNKRVEESIIKTDSYLHAEFAVLDNLPYDPIVQHFYELLPWRAKTVITSIALSFTDQTESASYLSGATSLVRDRAMSYNPMQGSVTEATHRALEKLATELEEMTLVKKRKP